MSNQTNLFPKNGGYVLFIHGREHRTVPPPHHPEGLDPNLFEVAKQHVAELGGTIVGFGNREGAKIWLEKSPGQMAYQHGLERRRS